MGIGGVGIFLRDQVQKPVGDLLLTGKGDGGEQGGSEPGFRVLAKVMHSSWGRHLQRESRQTQVRQ
jgi:hypothetical protein